LGDRLDEVLDLETSGFVPGVLTLGLSARNRAPGRQDHHSRFGGHRRFGDRQRESDREQQFHCVHPRPPTAASRGDARGTRRERLDATNSPKSLCYPDFTTVPSPGLLATLTFLPVAN